jgi:hypothetical protein
MKFCKYIAIAFAVLLAAVVSPASATPVPPCLSLTVTEGSHVKLTASPSGAGYTYDWTVPSALTGQSADGTNIMEFNVPACGGPWTVTLMMNPTGSPITCKSICDIELTCSGLCPACPVIPETCIADPTTWEYVCASAPDSLFYEWYLQTNVATIPIQTDMSTWGSVVVSDSKTYTPSPSWTGFNVPDADIPSKTTYVTFVVRQDSDGLGGPDTILKWCTKLVTLYYNPTATMASAIT